MKDLSIISYQGSKANLLDFISENIENYIDEGEGILDIFSGSGVVVNRLRKKYRVFANDSEPYASLIAASILNPPKQFNPKQVYMDFYNLYSMNYNKLYNQFYNNIIKEMQYIRDGNSNKLKDLYETLPSVWNNIDANITPKKLREENNYNLFCYYYSGSYFGLLQAIEIDSTIFAIHNLDYSLRATLYSCLFYAIKETVFSKDGHMAQPLSIDRYPRRHLKQREKSILDYFQKKLIDYGKLSKNKSDENKVYNLDFIELLKMPSLPNKISMIYADPPYTDMQYSRYYHLLNVAVNYDYPELTKTKNGYTKGLYTEGRNQSRLSQKSFAKQQIKHLIEYCYNNNIKLALSYAFPQNVKKQATDRYTMTINDLICMAKEIFGDDKIEVKQVDYNHSNHRNSSTKRVIEYLIMCGAKKTQKFYSIDKVKNRLGDIKPTNRNDMYNSHLYWSQKSFNVCDVLIEELSEEGDIVFDPFLGSGVTVLEAIKKGSNRIGIGCDVNEMPLFIPRTLLGCCFEENIKETIEDFNKKISELEVYYNTQCPLCNSEAIIKNVVFDKPIRTGTQIIIKSINYHCDQCGRKTKKPTKEDYDRINPTDEIIHIEDMELIQNSKIAVGEKDKISDIFTRRNLVVLDNVIAIINTFPDKMQNILKYILMSILHLVKITDKRSNSQWPLWIPKVDCVEKNVVDVLKRKSKNFNKAVKYVQKNYYKGSIVNSYNELTNNKCLLLNKGSQSITVEELPDKSVSLIITDPPYLEQVMYSEYMQLYKPFIDLDYNLEDEIVVSSSPVRNKNKYNYFKLLDEVFSLCADKLKDEGYMCLFFHDSNLDVWYKLISILEKNGFKYVSQAHIKKTRTLKNIISPKKSLNGDAILFFIKTNSKIPFRSGPEDITEIEMNMVKQAKHLIKRNGSMSTPELYDNGLMEVLIHNGWLKTISEHYNSLIDIFEKYLVWDKDLAVWKIAEG